MTGMENEVLVHIMDGYDSVVTPDGETAFGCYIVGQSEIYVAGDVPIDQLFHTIAHEYCHYLQDINGKEFSEDEADDFGLDVFTQCYQQGVSDTISDIEDAFSANYYPNGEAKELVISKEDWEWLKEKVKHTRITYVGDDE